LRPSAIPDNWKGVSVDPMQEKGDTHKSESVRVWVIDNIFLQFPARNPSGNELERARE
jgi:hypothetical protein